VSGPAARGRLSWTALGVRVGFAADRAQREQILTAVSRASWTDSPGCQERLDRPAVSAVAAAVLGHRGERLRRVGIARMGSRRLFGLEDTAGVCCWVLEQGCEAVHVLTELDPPAFGSGGCRMIGPVRGADRCGVGVGALGQRSNGSHPDPQHDAGGPAAGRAPSPVADPRSDGCQPRAVQALIAAYTGDVHRLLIDVASRLAVSLAYVDRVIVEAHLERDLTDREWAALSGRLAAMAFDGHVGDHGTFRTDWIEDRLAEAGVAGRRPPGGYPADRSDCSLGRTGGDAAGPCGEVGRRRRP